MQKKLKKEFYTIQGKFDLELGGFLQNPHLAYCTYGNLNAANDNVVWVFHALTASANAADWWEGMIGEGMAFDPTKDFIICVNILGSCYGSTGPNSINPITNSREAIAAKAATTNTKIRGFKNCRIKMVDTWQPDMVKHIQKFTLS